MKILIKKVITIILTIAMLVAPTTTAHAQDLSQYYAMSAQLMQMAMIMQAQAQQLMGAYGMQASAPTPAVDLQSLQAQQAQALAIQQAQQQAMAQAMAMAQAQQQAQAQQALLLAQPQVVQPLVQAPGQVPGQVPQGSGYYVLNTSSRKFHFPECRAVSTMNDSHYQESTTSRDELISSGYSPCGICNP